MLGFTPLASTPLGKDASSASSEVTVTGLQAVGGIGNIVNVTISITISSGLEATAVVDSNIVSTLNNTFVYFDDAWGSSTWGYGSWEEQRILLSATAVVNSALLITNTEANITIPSGLEASTAIGSIFDTVQGMQATSEIGALQGVTTTVNATPDGMQMNSSIGSFFDTNMGMQATTELGNTYEIEGNAFAVIQGFQMQSFIGSIFDTTQGLVATSQIETNVIVEIFQSVTITSGLQATATVDSNPLTINGLANITIPTGIQATSQIPVNPLTVNGDANFTISSGLLATTTIGTLPNQIISSNIVVNGIQSISSVGEALVWGTNLPNQTPNYNLITPVAGANYSEIEPIQNANYSGIEPNQNSNLNTITPSQNPSWTDAA